MAFCINTSHPEYLDLLASTELDASVLKAKISTWMEENNVDRFPTLGELNVSPSEVNQTLRIVKALPKIQRNIFTKEKLQGWINDLQKQGISSQQLELFKQEAKEGMTKDEIAAAIAANYSYTVEINTAKEKNLGRLTLDNPDHFIDNYGNEYSRDYSNTHEGFDYFKNDELITKEELEKARKESFEEEIKEQNTRYYSNLTVPGGTNYVENEIATPEIRPSIKGHAAFSSDSGIGWFRSDEKQNYTEQDIDFLIDNMIKSGILQKNCS